MNTRMNTRIRSIAVTTGVVLFGGVGVASALSSIGNDSGVPSPTTAPFSQPVVGESAGSMTSGPVTVGSSSSTTTTSVNPLGTLTVADTPMVPPSGSIGGSIGGDDDHDDDHEEYEDHDGDRDGDHDDDHDEDGDD